ncbi:LTA synthase family protein [Fuchsiella alkaliacetigena]|uniref:LTA synthase family protein n=1 Tax=Fuchsiella alkaliacetigena TaxID=957042 RepID=UPI00200A5F31|nr:LTA synthase family protein [Fuchsiella alkaliacetigena]MCK8823782.1 LTA synthase family protein [Fuchsiella alkaliacetigena]
MQGLNNLTKKQKCFAVTFLLGFLIKYNYLLIQIFNVPSFTGVIFKNLVFILFSVYFLFPMLKIKKGRIFLLLILSLFSLFFLANLWYNRYFGNYLSVVDMARSEAGGSSKVLFSHIINYWDLVFIVDLILLAAFLFKDKQGSISNQFGDRLPIKKSQKKPRVLAGVVIALLLIIQVFTTNLLLNNKTAPELYNRSTSGFVNVYGVIPLYLYELYESVYVDRSYAVKPETPPFLLADELDGEALIEEDSNIIVIQVESLDEKLLGYEHNERQLTPFLNELKEDSLYAENFYTKHVNGSFDADFSLLTSLYPVNRTDTFKNNDMTEFDSLARVLGKQGYETLAFHGNDKRFFNRHLAYPELGFDEFYSREDFSSADRVMEMEEGYLGINDYDFFKQSLDYLAEADSPFFAYFITVTSHTPFSFYPDDQTIEAYSDIEDQLLHDFFQSISFVDKSLEMFIEGLAEKGLKEDTLFVIYSDHDASIDTPEYSSSVDFKLDKNVKKPEHIPLLIKHPELEAGTIEKTGTITDLAPTILDIMGAETKPEGFIGSSLLKGEEAPVIFMHELPQVLYKDHLFVEQLGEFEKIGYLEDRREEKVELPTKEKDKVLDIMEYLRKKILVTERAQN